MNKYIAHNIYKTILNAKRVLLVPHQNPDGDALGSSTAFAEWLQQVNIPFDIFCRTDISETFSYLKHVDNISREEHVWEKNHDVLVVFDSGDLHYAGIDDYVAKRAVRPIIVNIDHHMTNQQYGNYNLLNTSASSTCEMVFFFFQTNGIDINQQMATHLLTGIITDTDNFTNSATSSRVIRIAGELTKRGADYNVIKDHVYKNISLNAFELWGRIFARLNTHPRLNIVHTYITQEDLITHGVDEDDTEGMSNFLNSIGEGHAGLILKETKQGNTKGSFRTTRNDVNVAKMAQHFGGGGHKKAAGFTIEKPIHEALNFILQELEQLFPLGVLEQEEA